MKKLSNKNKRKEEEGEKERGTIPYFNSSIFSTSRKFKRTNVS